MQAARTNDVPTLKRLLLSKEASVHEEDAQGQSPLLCAIEEGSVDAANILVRLGATVSVRCLIRAIESRQLVIFERLVREAAAECSRGHENGLTPLHLCAEEGLVDHLCKMFESEECLQNEEFIEILEGVEGSTTPLHLASANGFDTLVEKLLPCCSGGAKEGGARPDVNDEKRGTPLMLACAQGHESRLTGSSCKALDCSIHHPSIAARLMNRGAAASEGGQPPVEGEAKAVEVHSQGQAFQEAGNGCGLTSVDGSTDLMWATNEGDLERVKQLLAAKPEMVNECNQGRLSALMLASEKDHLEIARELLQSGADCNHCDNNGECALLLAAANGHIEMVELLVEYK